MRRGRAVTINAGSQVASRIGETSLADTRAGGARGGGETELRETKLRDGDDAATPPLAIKKKHAERMEHTEQRIASANASPAAVLDFYSDVGGVADVMRLDVNPTTGARAPEPVAFRDASSPPGPGSVLNASHHFVSKNRAPSRSEAVTRSPSAVPLNAEADRGHNDNHDSHDSHDASLATNDDRSQSAGVRNETFTRTSEQCHTNASAFLRVAPYAGAYAFGPNADDAAYGFMVSDAQTRELAELHAGSPLVGGARGTNIGALERRNATTRTTPNVAPNVAPTVAPTAPRSYHPTLRNRPVTGVTASPRRGLSARSAGGGRPRRGGYAHDARGREARAPESTASAARAEAAAAAQARAALRRELKGDDGGGLPLAGGGYLSDDDSSVDSEELDDLYLVAAERRVRRRRRAGTPPTAAFASRRRARGRVQGRAGSARAARRRSRSAAGPAARVLPGVMTHPAGTRPRLRARYAHRVAGARCGARRRRRRGPRRAFPAGASRGAALLRRARSGRLLRPEAGCGVRRRDRRLGFPNRDDGRETFRREETFRWRRRDASSSTRSAAAATEAEAEKRGGLGEGWRCVREATKTESRDAVLSSAAEERTRKQSAAVAAARAAAFKYGATTRPRWARSAADSGDRFVRRLQAAADRGAI